MLGQTISHYKILEKLGSGGMGEVYLALDTKIDRKVAIKFLPQHLTKDQENVERFKREAKAAAALNHPNIVTIHDISEFDGQIFIVMEHVDGKSLREVINEYKLGFDKIIDITNQISEGLLQAHKAEIVHRDLKPENIIIGRDGRVRILDFGLAKLKGVSKLTKETSTLGTIHYMSPEQIQGKEVDQRSDIWSVGVLLYEMLMDEVPFQGDYEQAVTYEILNEEPILLKEIESKYSPEMSSIVTKMISKEKENRYQNCLDLIDDLKRESYVEPQRKKSLRKSIYAIGGIIAITILIILSTLYFYPRKEDVVSLKSLAVIPFSNTKNDSENEYLEEALAAEIIKDLAYFKNVNVLPFSTIQKLENWNELKVDYRLTGNFIMENNAIRLNIELVNSKTEEIEWQESLEDEFKNTFKLLDDVSEKVINGLKIKFSPDEQERMKKDVPQNSLAYEHYLRAVAFPLSVEGTHHAISLLTESLNLDSSYAPTFTEFGFRKSFLAQYELGSSNLYTESEKFYVKSLNINPELLSALNNLAGLYVDLGKNEKALLLTQKALKINPNYAETYFLISYLCRYTGLLNESKNAAEKALTLDPSNVRFRSIGRIYIFLGEYSKAINIFDLGGESVYTYMNRGMIYFREGKIDSALKYFNHAINVEPLAVSGIFAKVMKAYIEHNKVEGLKIAKKLEESNPRDSEVLYGLACTYSLFDVKKKCLLILRRAIDGGFFCYPFMLKDTFLDPVRDDPEFKEVLALAKEKHEAFKQKYFAEKN